MGERMRAYDWAKHPLGNPDQWPQSLKNNIRLLLHSGFPMFIWWSKDFFHFYNDAYISTLGIKHPAALGASARELWAEIWNDVGGIAESILAGGKPFYTEGLLLYLDRNGFPEETYWTFSYSPAFNDGGQVAGVFCACTEMTNTILGQRRLKTLKDIADAMPQVENLGQACQAACNLLAQNKTDLPFSQIYLLNRSGTKAVCLGKAGPWDFPKVVELYNKQQEEIWNKPMAEVMQFKTTFLVDDLQRLDLSDSSAVQKAAVLPIFRPGQDQLIGFFVAGISPNLLYDADYQNFHKLLVGQIATSVASVQARQEIIRQQTELKDLFEQAPVAICILRGPEYVIELAIPGICEIWGKKQEDVLGKPVLEALPEVSDQGIKELLDGVVQTGIPYVNKELPLQFLRNGAMETVYVSFVYHPFRNVLGKIVGVIAVAIEINEQVEARHQVEAINQELLAINADLDNFVYAASHDLKAPISNIEGLMETLVEFLPPNILHQDEVQQVLSMIQASVGRFKRAVADLTEVAKVQREASEDVASIYLPEVVEDVQLDFENTIKAAGAQIKTHFSAEATVRFSAKNVRSIVYNLFSNALKYRSPQRALEITISTQATPDYIVLTVTDNGLGMRAEDQSKIFSMFKRLHDHVEGTGIGLYIVKRIVENAGGKIEVESQEGKGTTFQVYFKR